MIVLHDPSFLEFSVAYHKLTGFNPPSAWWAKFADQCERFATRQLRLGFVLVSWTEPDHTGMTPITMRRFDDRI